MFNYSYNIMDLPKDLGEQTELEQDQVETSRNLEKTHEDLKKQSELVHERSEDYWEKYILTKDRNQEELEFEFFERTYNDRVKILEQLDQDLAVLKTDSFDPQTKEAVFSNEEIEKRVQEIENQKVEVIIEQAYADFAFERGKIEQTKKELTEMAENVAKMHDTDELQNIKETVAGNLKKQTSFEIYSLAARRLFADYYLVDQTETGSSYKSKEMFLTLNNEFVKTTQIVDVQRRTMEENDSNLEIINRQINILLKIDWREVMNLIEEREKEMEKEVKFKQGETEDSEITDDQQQWVEKIKAELDTDDSGTMKGDDKEENSES